MSATEEVRSGGGDGLRQRRGGKLYWALADGWVLAKRNLVQIPRIPEVLDD